jgi:hypothetical protein
MVMRLKTNAIMKENLKDRDILLVKEVESDQLKVVAGTEENGKLKTVEPTRENESQFLILDKEGNMLENFMSNFLRQYNNPTEFNFLKIPLEKLDEGISRLNEKMKNPDFDIKKLNESVDPQQFEKQNTYTIHESRINWEQLERLGVSRETLERTKSLEAMLNWQKSPVLIPISAKFDDVTLRTDARLSFREMPDGSLTVGIHAIRKEPELDRPYFGIKFTAEDKENLLSSGNLGRIVNAEFKRGEETPVFISVDKLTNELVAMRADRIRIPEAIKGISLDENQKQMLSEGKAVYLENMTSKAGNEFSAHIQVDADKKRLGFIFNQTPSQIHQSEQKQDKEFYLPKTIGGVELTDKQRNDLRAEKTIYVRGMVDKQGQEYNAYIKINRSEDKLDFFKWNPDKSKAKEVTPDNASKTQVAVNSEGKTNEATKKVNEPLKNGQTQPTENQEKKSVKEQTVGKPKKSRGIKM